MSKIHPSDHRTTSTHHLLLKDQKRRPSLNHHEHPSVLTVWKRSSMSFQGTDGFTVFDPQGQLAFRVDNYSRKNGYGLLLMDGVGNALLTLKPKIQILSMQDQWNAYMGEEGRAKTKAFSMRSSSVLFHTGKHVAEIFMGTVQDRQSTPDLRIEGSFRSRDCKIIKISTGEMVAKISRKKVKNTTILLSDDVFSLVVQPGFETQLVMAFVIVLDRISSKPFTPVLCSHLN